MSEEFNDQARKHQRLTEKFDKLSASVKEENKYKAAYEKMKEHFDLVENYIDEVA